jgi:hypothetical protein
MIEHKLPNKTKNARVAKLKKNSPIKQALLLGERVGVVTAGSGVDFMLSISLKFYFSHLFLFNFFSLLAKPTLKLDFMWSRSATLLQ